MKKGSKNLNYPKNRKPRPLKNDLTGKIFGKLKVIKRLAAYRDGSVLWECKCECKNLIRVSTRHLNRKNNVVRSCGCLRKLSGNEHKDWKGCGDISGSWWASHIAREFKQASRAKIKIEIDKEYAWNLFLSQDRKCSLTGIELEIHNRFDINTASLDRIDSAEGYVSGNVHWVHKDINMMKRIYDIVYFIDMCTKVADYTRKKAPL